jgi:hypothetical protein
MLIISLFNANALERRMLKGTVSRLDLSGFTFPVFQTRPPTPSPTRPPTFPCTDSLENTKKVYDFLVSYKESNAQYTYTKHNLQLTRNNLNHGIDRLKEMKENIDRTSTSMSKLKEIFTPLNNVSLVLSYLESIHLNNLKIVNALYIQFKQTKALLDAINVNSIYELQDKINNGISDLPNVLNSFNESIHNAMETETCLDNTRLEIRSFTLDTISDVRSNHFTNEKISEFLQTVDKHLNMNLAVISTNVQKANHMISGMFSSVGEEMSRGYCCDTPLFVQHTVSFITGMMNLQTCAIDGLFQATINTKNQYPQNQLNFYHDIYNQFGILKRFIRNLTPHIVVTNLSFKDSLPYYDFEYKNIYSKIIPIDIKPFPYNTIEMDVLQNIGAACSNAMIELGSIGDYDCCRFYKTLGDGEFCDPANTVPENHCSICKSNHHEFWINKFHVACGYEPCFGDGTLCGVGTSCKRCCSKTHSYWFGKAMTACGQEPCWGRGTRCAAGTGCNRCCSGDYEWIWSNFGHFCT